MLLLTVKRKLGLGVLAVVLGLVGYGAYCILNEPGWLLVIGPPSGPIQVEVTGQAPVTIAPQLVHKWELSHGDYDVTVRDAKGRTLNQAHLKITTDRIILPASPSQCLVYYDVTQYRYGPTGSGDPKSLRVITRYRQNGQAFKWQSGYFFDTDLPARIQSGDTVRMLREVPCDMLDRPDREIFLALGYPP